MATLDALPRARWQPLGRHLRAAVLVAALLTAGLVSGACHAADAYPEDAVKAAFLYRFAGYVEWPTGASRAEPFTIAVMQADAVEAELQRLLPGHLVAGRPVRSRIIKSIQELSDAQILYIGATSPGFLRSVLASLKGRAVLVVTDDERGLEAGGMINFLSVDRRIRFEVSLLASERAGLKISSELLSVAARVEGERLRSEATCLPTGLTEQTALRCPMRVAAL